MLTEKMESQIEILDTTLRDGEQTDGVSFNSFEKRQITAILLEQLNVNRVEVASARVSVGEYETVKDIIKWSGEKGFTERIEILGFADHKISVDWILSAGGLVMNLLTKGSRRHCEEQLRKTIHEHIADIEKTISYATENGLMVNVYLEDWSNGYLDSRDYVQQFLQSLSQLPVKRFFLPDTLGIMTPWEVTEGITDCRSWVPEASIEFHGHNDYGLAVANSLAAVQAGVTGLHATINGLGERAGNTALETLITVLHDKTEVKTSINEQAITDVSSLVATFSRKRVASNQPIVGQDVFTHTAGIHADGDKKNLLYTNQILPERFARNRVYALGKLSGRASIINNLKMLGIDLDQEKEKALLQRIIELGEKKEKVSPDDLPYLIEDMFGSIKVRNIRIKDVLIQTRLGSEPLAEVDLEYKNKVYREQATGSGGYDAFIKALGKIVTSIGFKLPTLKDYEVRIPPGGNSDALVETIITWQARADDEGGKKPHASNFTTIGVDCDQIIAAVKATEKMLNRMVSTEL